MPASESASAMSAEPDWLNDLGGSAETPVSTSASSDQPDWLKELSGSAETPSQPASVSSDEPDWLKDLSDEPASVSSAPAAEELDFLKQMPEQPEASKPVPTQPAPAMDTSNLSAQAEDDAFAWLESLAVKQGSTEGLLVKPEDRVEEEPDWVKQAKSLSGEAEQLVGLAPSMGMPESMEAPADTSAGTIEELGKSEKEQDDSFAWLESLAVKQGSTEGLLVKPEERKDSEPDWVKQAKEMGEPLTPPTPREEEPRPAPSMDTAMFLKSLDAEQPQQEPSSDDTAVWLKGLDAETPVSEPVQSTSNDDTAMWLKSLDAETPAAEPAQSMSSDDTAMWLKSLDAETPASEPAQSASSDDTAMWLKSLDEPTASAEVESEQKADLPDWMQNVEAEESAPAVEAAVPSEVEAEVPSDESMIEEAKRIDTGALPSWLQDMDAREPASTSREDLPTWLRDDTGELVAEPTRIEPTRSDDWQPMETQAVDEMPEVKPEPVVEEKPQPAPKPKKAAEPKKPEPRPATPVSTYQEPVTRKGTGMLTQTVDMVLGQARNELNRSNIPGALETYAKLIKKGRYLDEIVFDLREASYRYPVEVSIWQTLGDAYMRGNRLQDALDAYTKAEELLR